MIAPCSPLFEYAAKMQFPEIICLSLQELSSRTAELEAQAAKLAGELSEYKAESKELKNQDLTIRKLEERVRGLEAQLEEKVRPWIHVCCKQLSCSSSSCIILWVRGLEAQLEQRRCSSFAGGCFFCIKSCC